MIRPGERFITKILQAGCYPFIILANFLDQISHLSLDNLKVSNDIPEDYINSLPESSLEELRALLCYTTPSCQILNLEALQLHKLRPAIFNPDIFPNLRSISF